MTRPRFAGAILALGLLARAAVAGEPRTITVAADGTGDVTSVQAAVDSLPEDNRAPVVVRIRPGTYKERIVVPRGKSFVTFRGEGTDPSQTVLTYDWNAKTVGPDGKPVGTSGSTSTNVGADDFTAENVTFENTAGDTGQAVAIKTSGDRIVFRNCRFVGWQDTLYPHGGRVYFKDCHVEGRVDFIFGRSVAVFEDCHIVSKNGGYVTAAATPKDEPFGFVFLDCRLTSADDVPTYLGRPWRDDAAVAFIRCEMGPHIRPEGWHNWGKPEREQTARYVEFGNTGPGSDRSKRVPWSRQLGEEEAAKYTAKNVLAGKDGWDPTAGR